MLRRRTPAADRAIDGARIEALFAPLAHAKGLLLAVSGGPDSTALMIMAAHWAKRPGRPKIEVATIDHGLRAGARAEAEAVAAQAKRRGFKHHLIEWRGEKPSSRIQERAREARHLLLAERALKIGADHVVTAHHADDQNETILFRLLRGSGVAGLKGMEAATPRGGVILARPLLGLSEERPRRLLPGCRARLSSTIRPMPIRVSPERVCAASPALLAAEGFRAAAGRAAFASRAARMEETVACATQAAAERLNWRRPNPSRRRQRRLFAEPHEVALRLLHGEVARVGGREATSIRLEQVEALA